MIFPISSPCYLNEAATSWPKAPGVVDALVTALEAPPSGAGRGGMHEPAIADRCPLGPAVGACRGLLASPSDAL